MTSTADLPKDGPQDGDFSDAAWLNVLAAYDRTYAELASHHEQLERQNRELHQLRHFIASILGAVNDIMVVLGRDARIEEASASFAACVRQPVAALTGTGVTALFDADGAALLDTALADLRLQGNASRFEANVMTPEGPAPFDIAVSPRVNDRGRMIGAVLIGRPLGELRAAYSDLEASHKQLKEAQTQLVRNEKLASLGRLLAGVAHELNNPISFVYASTHALERYVGRFETYFERVQAGATRDELVALRAELKLERDLKNLREAIVGARDGAERVRDIVADLRRLSASGTGERVVFDLVDTARVAARWVERGSKSGIEVQFTGLPNLSVRGVPGHIQQIVMNLVQNAMDAMQGQANPQLVLRIEREGDRAVLAVTDTGPGVPEDQAASIFDPFYTTKPVGQGTGLGLSISHKIAEEHGGRLSLCPPTETGACFRLELPMDDPQ
ncbi:PAS domain-containing protein [Rhodobacter sp. NTK016B]|uniref:sensor histidine kinase n=1 Tax=Rhodobacter sp. NTK016B TaxID=2759676 RepID=UPI001A90B615|nr:ATP-binding protein [Rhodobacter sp. NTK016B]MBN8293760.1 PAS domain-containing protein [Rhodobacter sp. NTK016B]